MAEKENQQYKWRQRKKRNALTAGWLIGVVVVAAAGTFVYNGTKEGNPLNVAKKYVEDVVGASDYTVETGPRSLNDDNEFVQEYTFTYTADGGEVTKTINTTQSSQKKYGLFEQWQVEGAGAASSADTMDLELIAPAGSQVLVNGVAPTEDQVLTVDTLSPGAVCYQLTGIPKENSKLQVTGLPFDAYETTLDGSVTTLDVRDQLVVGENAKTQMSELAKQMINELFTAVVDDKGADSLGTLFDSAANKTNLYNAIHTNLYDGDSLKVSSLSFADFTPTFGEVYYPGTDEESYIGMEMKMSYTVTYEEAEPESESETETEAQTETESESETETEAATTAAKEASFYFQYKNGSCTVTQIEVPNAL